MTIIMVMIMVNIADAKARLSEYLEAVSKGETVVICRHNQPVAELRAIEPARVTPRDLTPIFPGWKIDPAFFQPLDEEDLTAWEGGGDVAGASQVAERQPAYGPTRKSRKRT
jgi:prevent-host-death family protein